MFSWLLLCSTTFSPFWNGYRPVSNVPREGEQNGFEKQRVNRMPSFASRSRFGVRCEVPP